MHAGGLAALWGRRSNARRGTRTNPPADLDPELHGLPLGIPPGVLREDGMERNPTHDQGQPYWFNEKPVVGTILVQWRTSTICHPDAGGPASGPRQLRLVPIAPIQRVIASPGSFTN